MEHVQGLPRDVYVIAIGGKAIKGTLQQCWNNLSQSRHNNIGIPADICFLCPLIDFSGSSSSMLLISVLSLWQIQGSHNTLSLHVYNLVISVNDEGERIGKCLIVLNGIHLISVKMMLPWSMSFNHSREIFPNFKRH